MLEAQMGPYGAAQVVGPRHRAHLWPRGSPRRTSSAGDLQLDEKLIWDFSLNYLSSVRSLKRKNTKKEVFCLPELNTKTLGLWKKVP